MSFRFIANSVNHKLIRSCPRASGHNNSAIRLSSSLVQEAREKMLREDLAAACRMVSAFGWSPDFIHNHISVKIPDRGPYPLRKGFGGPLFLINPYGIGYEEITASSLVVIDSECNVVDKGSSSGLVNKAGFVGHKAIHTSREDLNAVMHTNAPDVAAVSALASGLLPVTRDSMVLGPISYHDFEGIAMNEEECERLGNDLGRKAKVMVLRNHGILVGGGSVPEMMTLAYFAHKSCTIQVRALAAAAMGQGGGLRLPSPDVVKLVHAQARELSAGLGRFDGELEWGCMKRRLDRIDPGYRA